MTDLAALVAMRLTHDLAGPLGAVATGIDMLDCGDPELRALVADGAAAAVASLRLHRFILAPTPDSGNGQALLGGWMATREGMTLAWTRAPTTPDIVLGLAMTAVEAARSGGAVTIDGDTVTVAPPPRLDPSVAAALAGEPATIGRAALAGILHARAAACGGSIVVADDGGALRLSYQGNALPR